MISKSGDRTSATHKASRRPARPEKSTDATNASSLDTVMLSLLFGQGRSDHAVQSNTAEALTRALLVTALSEVECDPFIPGA